MSNLAWIQNKYLQIRRSYIGYIHSLAGIKKVEYIRRNRVSITHVIMFNTWAEYPTNHGSARILIDSWSVATAACNRLKGRQCHCTVNTQKVAPLWSWRSGSVSALPCERVLFQDSPEGDNPGQQLHHARAEQLGELGLPGCDDALSGMGDASLTNEVPGVM